MISTQAARLQEEEDSQFDLIQKLEREEGRHRELAERARKEASRVDGEKGSAEAEKRRGEAEVRSPRFEVSLGLVSCWGSFLFC